MVSELEPSPGRVARHAAIACVWLLSFRLLSDHLLRAVPLSIARELSLAAYTSGVQVLCLAVGLGLAFLLLPNPRQAFGLELPRLRALAVVTALAPAAYVLASYAAIYVALPTLLSELAERGRAAVQASTGEFGRELVGSGVVATLLFTVVLSPIAEELMFRGAVWSFVQSIVELAASVVRPAAAPDSSALSPSVIEPSFVLSAARSLTDYFRRGFVATLATTAVFAWMHADMPGGLGIVRWMSALGLGLATGVARQASGSLFAAMLLHALFNLASVAATRRWVVTESFPMKLGVPTLLSLVGSVGALVALSILAVGYFGRRARTAAQ
ncbi:MAG: CPBP family intramembrane glutamic endopeptidase [Polyangiaceae bacterium]